MQDLFLTTRWTSVLAAADADTGRALEALGDLCQAYWYPLYAYARRRGYDQHDAEDLTQGFFERLLKLNSLAGLSRERGKFRAFLLASMNHYLADEWSRASAQKRSLRRTISLDAEQAEGRYAAEAVDKMSPERLFERAWALTVLEAVVQRLRLEYEASGRGAIFMELRFAITGEKNAAPYADLAARLGISEESVRVGVHRLRQRYRSLLREEIARTVGENEDVQVEMQHLRSVLAS